MIALGLSNGQISYVEIRIEYVSAFNLITYKYICRGMDT